MSEDDHKPKFADDLTEREAQVRDLIFYGKMLTRIDPDGTTHRVDPAEVYLDPPAE